MSEPTALDLAAIRARCDAATPGPWFADDAGCDDVFPNAWQVDAHLSTGEYDGTICDYQSEANAQFIAHARTDLPALLAHAEALAARVAALEAALALVVRIADDTAAAYDEFVQRHDEYRRGQVRGAHDAARPARAELRPGAPREEGAT